ncbi:stromal interaction molecule homolog isoform X2 [Anabrus simplex]|uniref:stromal interaction molecule homolog isoform X2 n=1 Tax=Anabrus simplex TaxID=316456 RepID=UPI0035A39375
MHTIFRSVLVLCLLVCGCCDGQPSEPEVNREIRQERTFKPSYSSGNVLTRTASSHSLLGDTVSHSQSAGFEAAIGEGCSDADVACLTLASHDRIGLEAIRTLHRQLDDDANGNVDLSESDEFLREELKYEEGYERRQRAFHRNDDNHISVRELWEAWIRSEVHNWTVEQTSEWLATNVELPQYIPNFILHRVTGAMLPRLAVNNMHYLSNVLGIKDPIHKQKIALKAMDVVLFGPPKDYGHALKDFILISLLTLALLGCWYAYGKTKSSQNDVRRMMKHMESLQKAELALDQLQKELERARMEQEYVTSEKQNLERQLLEQGSENLELRTSYSDLEVSQLKAEIELLRGELKRAEGELEDRCWSPPVGLQQWLQLTHEIENKAYIKKKMAAEKQLQQAREACEKLRKKRSSLVGAFVSTHGKSIDDVDRSIVEARTALNEVTQELQERVHRWKQIELLCGFNVINNSGLQYLENVLYRGTANGRGGSSVFRGRMSSSQDDLDDDTSSLYSPSAGCLENMHWKEADSSESETGKLELDDDFQQDSRSLVSNVHFTVGGDSWSDDFGKSRMIRSYSQDTTMLLGDKEGSPPSTSQSETCLDSSRSQSSRVTSIKKVSKDHVNREPPLKEQSSREHIAKELSSHEPGARDNIPKDVVAREHVSQEHTLKELTNITQERTSREPIHQDHHPSREHGFRDHSTREHGSREHSLREHSTQEPLFREQSSRESSTRESLSREHISQPIAREHAIQPIVRDHVTQPFTRDHGSRDHGTREPTCKESTSREPAASKVEQTAQTVDEETNSTDSNSTTEDDIRRKKRKLFPTFNRVGIFEHLQIPSDQARIANLPTWAQEASASTVQAIQPDLNHRNVLNLQYESSLFLSFARFKKII